MRAIFWGRILLVSAYLAVYFEAIRAVVNFCGAMGLPGFIMQFGPGFVAWWHWH